ncbi:MAG TPA: histidine phosphatase family protein [Steroidobacteraceae bacterium]|nr:histidine phosphatase family protein [Steroidobacteraceae bacterium]
MNRPEGRVLLMRHAHAEWPGYSGEDFDRPLTPRGLADAAASARAMRAAGNIPDLLLASPARRTRQTAEVVAATLELPSSAVRFVDSLYNASVSTLARELQRASSAGLVLLVAHNPGISALAQKFAADPARPPLLPAGWGCFSAPASP